MGSGEARASRAVCGWQLKRLQGIAASPVHSLFSEVLDGLTTLRAYRLERQELQALLKRMDVNSVAFFYNCEMSPCLVVRNFGFLFSLFTALSDFSGVKRMDGHPRRLHVRWHCVYNRVTGRCGALDWRVLAHWICFYVAAVHRFRYFVDGHVLVACTGKCSVGSPHVSRRAHDALRQAAARGTPDVHCACDARPLDGRHSTRGVRRAAHTSSGLAGVGRRDVFRMCDEVPADAAGGAERRYVWWWGRLL